jgi:hypothetical protein
MLMLALRNINYVRTSGIKLLSEFISFFETLTFQSPNVFAIITFIIY